MQIPLELSFREVEKTPALEAFIRREVDSLEEVNSRITSCHAAVERPQEHQTSGSGYRVRVVYRVPPRHEVVIRREPGEGMLHDDVRTVLKEVFDASRRRLRELDRRLREPVKEGLVPDETGFVVRLFRDEGYGFVRSLSGREVYFHRNSVLHGDFDRLEVGTRVRFATELGDEGLQTTSLERLGEPPLRTAEPGDETAAPPPGWRV